ncbi:hypothetical protein [Pectobacterium phage PcaP1EGY]
MQYKWLIVIAVAFSLAFGGWTLGSKNKDAEWRETVNQQYITKVKAKEEKQNELNSISKKHQDDMAAIQGSTDRVISDLRIANKRLQVRVKSTAGTLGPDGRCIVDGPVELHESTARSLIQITESADRKEQALQATIRALTSTKGVTIE